MPHRTFFWFILPSLAAMLLFIAAPIASVIVQSFHIQHEQVVTTVETCGPFGCTQETVVDAEATAKLRAESPMGRFNGFGNYIDRGHLAVSEVKDAWTQSSGPLLFLLP